MNALYRELCVALLMGSVLPGLFVNTAAIFLRADAQEPPAVEVRQTVPVSVRYADGSVASVDLEIYLTGVLLGEMPADFEPEALKAQAVAARTYTAKTIKTAAKHTDGSICTDSACCQAYCSEEVYLASGGTQEALEKIRAAVLDTAGWVLTYDGELIDATYFSCSGGQTEDAAAVWGVDYPYLQAVSSPGEEKSVHYRDSLRFSADQFQQKLGKVLPGEPAQWFAGLTRTPGGGVDKLEIAGETYTGTALRSLLGLPSTAFTVQVEGDTIIFATRGYGHRVGMSQYGADAMAVAGSTYSQILAHYYPGTILTKLF